MPPKSRPPSRLKKHHLVLTKDAESSRRRSIQMLAARKGPPENEGPASRSSRNGVSRAVEDSCAPRRTLTSSHDDFNPCLLRLEEASACFRDELKTLVELASNFRDDVDTLKDEVTGRGKLHDVRVPSSEETNSVIKKLKGENLMLKIECGFLREENVELSNRCVQALNGSLNTQHDAVKKMMDNSILKKNNMVEDTRGMVDPIQAPQKEIVNHNSYHDDPYAKEFGITISERLASVEARVLPTPRLKYSEAGREKDCLPRVGQWNMMNKKLVNGGRIRSWMCVNFARNVQDSVATGFCRELARMCQASGMEFALEPVLPAIYVRPDQVERALKARFHDALNILGLQRKELDLLIGILPDNNGSLYGDLKRVCEIDLGLISQCCLTKQVFKMNKQILANLALKINVKVGGRNTVLADAVSRCIPLLTDKPTIIFGADVTHPHPGEDSSPSISAVVASQDWPEVTKYAGLVSAQSHRQELIDDLYNVTHDPQRGTIHGGMIRELLISFKRCTGEKPQRILFYRDGVSEGQFYQVLLHELDAIRKACASLEANYQPQVTFIVVQKRHHTRLFPHNHNDQSSVDRSGNILPGPVFGPPAAEYGACGMALSPAYSAVRVRFTSPQPLARHARRSPPPPARVSN
ncbi:hypothetical protein QYE76_066355 [Lolium multiflorum]|uniref:Piwi domain-containing protein n=1 Tax=Lolium multiflorum TaxID=4521 RepID=A0AAD8SAV5_LOLMU|nr:hypothetical protein QYE76_066355 [Lolium multiflorum]